MAKVDLHNHFRTRSIWHKGDFNRAINTISQRMGQDAIVGLINFEDRRYETFSCLPGYERVDLGNALYIPGKRVTILRGQEIPTKQGHLLVLGLEKGENLLGYKDLENTLNEARMQGGITIADHPFTSTGIYKRLAEKQELLWILDGVEVHNGETLESQNFLAEVYHLNIKETFPHIIPVVSSDGHSFYEIGSSYMEINPITLSKSKPLRNQLLPELRSSSNSREHNSYIGALDHILDLAVITGLSRFGIKL